MRILHLADRFPGRGGADAFLLDWMESFRGESQRLLVGRGSGELSEPPVLVGVCSDLASPSAQQKRMSQLKEQLDWADQVHLHNIMNPTVIQMAVETGRATAVVQDHRVFCPGRGKETSAGDVCEVSMSADNCAACFEDQAYGDRLIAVTQARRDALVGANLVVLSEYMAEELSAVGLRGAVVHPPAISTGPPALAQRQGFLMGGRLVSHKGIAWGYEAWQRSGVSAPLNLVGTGPEAALCSNASTLGWLNPDDLRAALRAARALIFPARWQEPYGILGVEALAEGTPVILMDSGGTGDWAREGVIHCDRGDVDAMADAIRFIVENPTKAQTLGARGQAWVRESYSEERLFPQRMAWAYEHQPDS